MNGVIDALYGVAFFHDDECVLRSPEAAPADVCSCHAYMVLKCNAGTPVAFLRQKSEGQKLKGIQGHVRVVKSNN